LLHNCIKVFIFLLSSSSTLYRWISALVHLVVEMTGLYSYVISICIAVIVCHMKSSIPAPKDHYLASRTDASKCASPLMCMLTRTLRPYQPHSETVSTAVAEDVLPSLDMQYAARFTGMHRLVGIKSSPGCYHDKLC
jgi:hypothetical protein